YSVDQIDSILNSKEFKEITQREVNDDLRYYFKTPEDNASMGTVKFSKGKWISSSLPTNIGNPIRLDFDLMNHFSKASGAANYDFDQLYIPFRCNATDIELEEEVVFRSGNLATAIRASMTYPFFVEPIRVDGKLLFDGGILNNFPSNILYDDFLPDVILGCNVSENFEEPDEDDFFSLLNIMVTQKTNFDLVCENMVIVNPEIPVGTFDFDQMDRAIGASYEETKNRMPEILSMIERRVSLEERTEARKLFWSKQTELVFDQVTFSGIDKTQKSYLKKIINKKGGTIGIEQLKRKYFKAFSDDKIKSIYPTATLNTQTQAYGLHLNVKKEKDLFLEVGGIYSSRPINTGYIGLKYNLFGKTSSTLWANSYFGKFYGSVSAGARFDFASGIPFSIEPNLVFNRWDYFTSFATFFEDVQPSFIVVNERFGGLKFKFPVRNKGRLEMNFDYAEINDDYYQNTQFLPVDTADRTRLIVGVASMEFDRNTLNRKQFPNKGTRFNLTGKVLSGEEQTIPGSTSSISDTTYNQREWIAVKLAYTNYFQKLGPLKIGFHLEGVGSTQPFMRNHVSSLISAPAFQPIPES
ncbi:MAG: patatin-like phospholipase family protein, partial [Flavobacteriales bacterium]